MRNLRIFGSRNLRPSQAAVAGRTRCCSCRLACWPKAIDAGATVTMEIADQFWGDRFGSVKDPFGHSWSIATHVEDLTPEEIADTSLVPSPQQPSSSLNAGKATLGFRSAETPSPGARRQRPTCPLADSSSGYPIASGAASTGSARPCSARHIPPSCTVYLHTRDKAQT
jgi:hypothetical protein